ncbi:MAG: hypothetical protein HFF39_06395 [Lawsonibacter sp.]|nr:hypothetical protein [Lawsonibacter sp.]
MTLMDVLIDFSYISLLLMIGYWLRRHVKILQHYYIPVALIAGILGLLLGPQVLGRVSPVCFAYSSSMSQWSGILSTIVFACSFLGQRLEKVTGGALQTYFMAGSIHQAQVLAGMTLAIVIGFVIPELPIGFGLLPVLGFYGGHGLAIPAGRVFDDIGYMTGGSDVAATFATIGILCGVIWGIIIINRAARKGQTTVKMKIEDMPPEELTGYYPPEKRKPMCDSVSSSSTLDPLGSQLLVVGVIILSAYVIRTNLMAVVPFFTNVPLFAFALVISAVFTIATQKSKRVMDMIDRKAIIRISGAALEYMIASNLALTNLSVFVTYAVPLVIMSIAVAAVTYLFSFVISKRVLYKNGWLETSIGLFGQSCGVLSTGLLLLKVVDPDYKTNAATNITSSSTLGYTFQLQYTLVFMTLVTTAPMFVYAWSWGLFAILFGLGLFFGARAHKRGD